ncbi:calcium-binding protein [Phormidium tenue FACHB-886]|nr:calcium-binding protein [Phormidium tenue FACHB-886]
MRILVARNVIYSYLFGNRSLRGTLATYLLNKIQQEPHLQGFLSETAFQDTLNKLEELKDAKAEQEVEQARLVSAIRRSLYLLPTNSQEFRLGEIENEEFACALQNNLDALVTHDLSYYQLSSSILSSSILIWTVGEFLNQSRRSHLNRIYLKPTPEATVPALLDWLIPITDSSELSSLQELTEHLLQGLQPSSHTPAQPVEPTVSHDLTFGNEARLDVESPPPQVDDLLSGGEAGRLNSRAAHTAYRTLRKPAQPEVQLPLETDFWESETTEKNLNIRRSLASVLALLLVLLKFQLDQPEFTTVLEQRPILTRLSLHEVGVLAAIFSSRIISGFNHPIALEWALAETLISKMNLLEIRRGIEYLSLIDDKVTSISNFVSSIMEIIEEASVLHIASRDGDLSLSSAHLFEVIGQNLVHAISQPPKLTQYVQTAAKELVVKLSDVAKFSDVAKPSNMQYSALEVNSEALIRQINVTSFNENIAENLRDVTDSELSETYDMSFNSTQEDYSNSDSWNSISNFNGIGLPWYNGRFSLGSSSVVQARANGTSSDDYLSVHEAVFNFYLNGGRGDDRIVAGRGDDYLNGDRGNDILTGGPGADKFITGYGTATITDYDVAEGDLIFVLGEATDYSLSGGGSNTTLAIASPEGQRATDYSLSGESSDIEFRVKNPTVARLLDVPVGHLIATVKNTSLLYIASAGTINRPLIGTDTDDLLIGNSGSNLLFGEAGDDMLIGDSGRRSAAFNLLEGGKGADTFVLGDSAGAFHSAGGFSTITDFDAGEGDRLQLIGSSTSYDFEAVGANIEIRVGNFQLHEGDLISVLKNTNSLNLNEHVKFIG